MAKVSVWAPTLVAPLAGILMLLFFLVPQDGDLLRGTDYIAEKVPAGDAAVQPYLDRHRLSCVERRIGHPICPRLFVLGAQKGGTTTFYKYMSSHKEFRPAMPLDGGTRPLKEVAYFIKPLGETPGGDPSAERRKELVKSYLPYFPVRQDASEWSSDATPAMMYHAQAPWDLINSGVSDGARFIILLRNPVDRAISNMEKIVRGRGTHPAPESYRLKDVADTCIPILNKCRAVAQASNKLGYFHCMDTMTPQNIGIDMCDTLLRGFYVDGLKNWLSAGYDGQKQFCILPTERFMASPAHALNETGTDQRCFAETGVDLSRFADWEEIPQDGHYNKHNWTLSDEDIPVRRRLEKFYAVANEELKQVLADSFGIADFKYEWP